MKRVSITEARRICEQIGARGVIVLSFRNHKGSDMSEWPEDLRVREFPEVAHGNR